MLAANNLTLPKSPTQTGRWVIREHRPMVYAAWVVAGIGIWIAIAIAIAWWVRATELSAAGDLIETNAALTADVARLQQTADQQASKLANLERQIKIDAAAADQLRQTLIELQTELADAREELGFYERLVGSGRGREGLAIHDLQLSPTSADGVYAYRLTLLQNMQRARVVSGSIDVRVEAVLEGRLTSITPTLVSTESGEDPMSFHFKYFQQLEGLLEIPDDASEQAIVVELDPESGSNITRRFEFDDTLKDGAARPTENNQLQD